jgi:predicted transcriptional regulator
LIVSGEVLTKITGFVDIELVKKYLKEDKLRIYVKEDIKVALALTENSFSLGLFSPSGMYDDRMDLLSDSNESIEWGERLFEDVARHSTRVGLEYLS